MTNETRSPHEQAPEDPLMQQQATPATELVVEPEAAATEPAAAPEPAAKEMADLPSDHPLLRRAQEALRRQLSDQKLRLQEELRERRKALKDAKQRREDVGVELYGFQQHLAKLQTSLEQASDEHGAAAAARARADSTLAALRSQVAEEEAAADASKAQVEAVQKELDRLAAALRAVQAHNDAVASEVAVAKRATYATEGAVQALEVQTRQQDQLIDSMQQQLRRLGRQAEVQAAALLVQRSETGAARQLSAAALADMETVAFEKKQLLGQWRSSLVAMQKRNASLEALHAALRSLEEQHGSVLNEGQGYRRQLAQQRQRNEQAADVVERLVAQAARVAAQVEDVQQRQQKLTESHESLQQQLAARQRELEESTAATGKLAAQRTVLDRQLAKLGQQAAAAEQAALERLGQQTFAEQGAQHVLRDIEAVRAAVRDKEAAAEQLEAALSRLQADAAASHAGGDRLAALLAGLEATVAARAAAVAGLEAEMKLGHADVEAKARQVEALNRRYQKLLDGGKDVETGPLEATIANLQREITAKEAAGREVQRRWIVVQGQLVAAQADNAEQAEVVAAQRAQQAVLQQKRARLEAQLQAQQREAQALSKALAGVRAETSRLNALLADAAGQHSALHEDNVLLEGRLGGALKALEARWLALSQSIQALREQRAAALAALVEGEREVMVWERRVQLEKEMQEAVDPAYGNEELAAARREVARLTHAAAALARDQEALVGELERAVEKREAIGTKARLAQSQRVQDMTASQARRQAEELQRAAARAEREARAAGGRVEQMGQQLVEVQAAAATAGAECAALHGQQEGVQAEVEGLSQERHKALVATSLKQREARRYEDVVAGRYKPAAATLTAPEQGGGDLAAALAAETERAQLKQDKLQAAVQRVAAEEAAARPALERVLAHAAAMAV
ncbi:hypothetical protein D9Q98_008499 [Chlorella vulgaris]|uniref:Coiled-coil domain-containing protein 40 n=1 Tax=Chlorella vulgaris TaxID=3077 RepID=A0A9D4YTY3_CHLVU|nr:hypothetical protein D9Q98_008499 [Chlorella vulgaris]